mgnify:CR=1 FL=1
MKSSETKIIKLIFFFVALILFFLIAKPIDLLNFLKSQEIYTVLNSMLILIISYFVYAIRWSILICVSTQSKNYFRFILSYLVSLFYNSFTPANLGGDAYRIIEDSSKEITKTEIFAYLLFERFIGLAIFILFSILMVHEIFSFFMIDKKVFLLIILVTAIIIFIILNPKSMKFILGILFNKVNFFDESFNVLVKTYRNLRLVMLVTFISLVGIFLSVFAFNNLLEANNLNLNFLSLLGIFCAIEIIRIIPITYQGFGFREAFFAFSVTSITTFSFEQAIYLSGFYYVLVSFSLAITGFATFILKNIIGFFIK